MCQKPYRHVYSKINCEGTEWEKAKIPFFETWINFNQRLKVSSSSVSCNTTMLSTDVWVDTLYSFNFKEFFYCKVESSAILYYDINLHFLRNPKYQNPLVATPLLAFLGVEKNHYEIFSLLSNINVFISDTSILNDHILIWSLVEFFCEITLLETH